MMDFINSPTEFPEENISSVKLNYADYSTHITEHNELSSPDKYLSFFEKDASYIVSMLDENDQKFIDDSYTVVEHNENSLVLKNTLETEYGTIDKYIMISLKLLLIQEWTDIGFEHECVLVDHYEIEKINSDAKELTFMFKDSLQKVIKIRKL
ncbi:MAG: hypothetical protein ACR5KV_02955 [Wolbachia sp.]